jgi:hypothetical protein
MNGLGSLFPPVVLSVHDGGNLQPPCRTASPVWLKPVSTFGLFCNNDGYKSSHLLAMPFDPSPLSTLVLVEPPCASRLRAKTIAGLGVRCQSAQYDSLPHRSSS